MKAWVIFERIEERNLDFVEAYRRAAAGSVATYNGRYLTVSFNNTVVEGPSRNGDPRMIAIKEFPSRADAERWFDSDEYRLARKIREAGVTNRTMIIDAAPPAYAHQDGREELNDEHDTPAWVVFERLEERNLDFVPAYRRVAAASVAKFGGRYQTVSFVNPIVEGPDLGGGPNMISIIGFESRSQALAWFESPDYREAIDLRREGVTNRALVIDVIPPRYAVQHKAR
ncbi:DUF1330 domain-containing protein (plasmid) [Rhizobium bangladeshense]|uniref:DUF1330 domain-containing protein n=1 Tax=Rhizobium bangladeshense TaxID=1138189 RepID=UPI001A999757|nr:DUF1330 domain-containing protein [Rhizobium bangladeshense]QSY97891.1 DUF1330 domain-containing protein [Rhizobium bangladeshense]